PDVYLPVATASRLATDLGMHTDGLNRFFSGSRPAATSPASPLSMFTLVARSGGDAVQAQAQLSALEQSGQLPRSQAETSTWHIRPLVETMVALEGGTDLRVFLALLAGGVGLTLLIGCANLASLFLARSEERRA